MASVVSTSNSNYVNSLLSSKNMISGMASGMDTEAMIEKAVSGYQMKLDALQQQRTGYEWKQEAYRGFIDKLAAFSQKYASFTSGTNLLGASFFNNAVNVSTHGVNSGKISATGKTKSAVEINGVDKLATAARYTVSAAQGGFPASNAANASFDPSGTTSVSTIAGSMQLTYGSKAIMLKFGADEVFNTSQDMANAINDKLDAINITLDSGTTKKASELFEAHESGGVISFVEKGTAGNAIKISGASENIKTNLGLTLDPDAPESSFTFNSANVVETKNTADFLSDKPLTITLDGVSKEIYGPTKAEMDAQPSKGYEDFLQEKIDAAFGAGKLSVQNLDTNGEVKLEFTLPAASGSTFSISSAAGKTMGMEQGLSSYLNTSTRLGDMVDFSTLTQAVDESGALKFDKDNKALYELKINGKVIGEFTEDSSYESVLNKINTNGDASVTMTHSKTSDQLTFVAKETGALPSIEFESGGLSGALFGGGTLTGGQDAQFTATIDGQQYTMTRSSNNVDLEGLKVQLKDTFSVGSGDVTFTTSADSDKIVDAVKGMVGDLNAVMNEIREAYTTLPKQKANGDMYKPLTDAQAADMKESAVTKYENDAKMGLLFGDANLSGLYNGLMQAITALSADSYDLSEIGLSVSYEKGAVNLSLDETKLRSALDNDMDKVRDVFTKTKSGGAGVDGLMQGLKRQMDKYASTTGAVKGILVQTAGTKLASTSLMSNEWQRMIDNLDKQIESWQGKLSNRVDFYVGKFSQLEQLVARMNSQSSALMGLMGVE